MVAIATVVLYILGLIIRSEKVLFDIHGISQFVSNVVIVQVPKCVLPAHYVLLHYANGRQTRTRGICAPSVDPTAHPESYVYYLGS